MPCIDFFLSLDVEVSDAWSHYSEQLVRMEFINTIPLSQMTIPDPLPPKTVFGVSKGASYALVLGRLFKLHPDFDSVVVQILLQAPHAYVLLIREAVSEWNEIIWNRIKQAVLNIVEDVQSGGDVLRRIRFVPYELYSDALLQASVVLDTFPYGGCVTSHDAVSNGVPTVTLPSTYIRGRFMYAMYIQMNHTDLLTTNTSEYASKVAQLLTDNTYFQTQSASILHSFHRNLHKNLLVTCACWTALKSCLGDVRSQTTNLR
eukprot:gene2643-5185_t